MRKEVVVATLEENVAVYEKVHKQLERDHMGKWVVIYDEEIVGLYSDFQEAAQDAVIRFGSGPYHIKQIGEPPLQISPTLMFGLTNAKHAADKPRR